MANVKRSTGDLSYEMSTLPQELRDEIYDLVFTAEPGTRIVDKHYKAPRLLHVDRASRAKFSKSYYSGEGVSFIEPASENTGRFSNCKVEAWAAQQVYELTRPWNLPILARFKRDKGAMLLRFYGHWGFQAAEVRARVLENVLLKDDELAGSVRAEGYQNPVGSVYTDLKLYLK